MIIIEVYPQQWIFVSALQTFIRTQIMRFRDNVKPNKIRGNGHWGPLWKRGITPDIFRT